MKQYSKPTVSRVTLVTSPVLGGSNSQSCKGAGEPYTGHQGEVIAGMCKVTCFAPVVIGGGS